MYAPRRSFLSLHRGPRRVIRWNAINEEARLIVPEAHLGEANGEFLDGSFKLFRGIYMTRTRAE